MSFLISHTLESGTLLEGAEANDGSRRVLIRYGWSWSRAIRVWYLPYSRTKLSRRSTIDATTLHLRARGFQVEIDIDDASMPLPAPSSVAGRSTLREPSPVPPSRR